MISEKSTENISPTAHYTGYTWFKNGLSPAEFATDYGRLLYQALSPFMWLSSVTTGYTIEDVLMQRHQIIDSILEKKIESGEIGQVIEIACGLSPRGYRFSKKYPDLKYFETDLSGMLNHKKQILERMQYHAPNHFLVEVDALKSSGDNSLQGYLSKMVDKNAGTAIITEGLIGYLNRQQVTQLWKRLATFLNRFSSGLYLSDLHTEDLNNQFFVAKAFKTILGLFVQSEVVFPVKSEQDALTMLAEAGFSYGLTHDPLDFKERLGFTVHNPDTLVRVIEAGHES